MDIAKSGAGAEIPVLAGGVTRVEEVGFQVDVLDGCRGPGEVGHRAAPVLKLHSAAKDKSSKSASGGECGPVEFRVDAKISACGARVFEVPRRADFGAVFRDGG